MKEFINVEFFKSPALVCRYITTHKIPKRKILSLVHNGKYYALFYYTTLRKEDNPRREPVRYSRESLPEEQNANSSVMSDNDNL